MTLTPLCPCGPTQGHAVEIAAVLVGSMQGAERPACRSSLGDPHGSRWAPDWDGVPHMVLVLGTPSATSIEHGSRACRKGSAMSRRRVCTPGGMRVRAASGEGHAHCQSATATAQALCLCESI